MTRRTERKRRLWARIRLGAILSAVLIYVGWMVFGDGGLWESRKLRQTRIEQADRIALLEARKLKIQQYLDRLKDRDELAYETAARRYGLVGPNETIYRIQVKESTEE